jgi:hypothetical protein
MVIADVNPAAVLGGVLLVVLLALAAALAIIVFFLLTLHKAIGRCSPRNRTMAPSLVWLNLIPFVSFIMQFVTAMQVANSLRNEYEDRGLRGGGDYSKGLGIAYACVSVGNFVFGQVSDNAPVSVGILVCGLVLFITYWIRVAGLSRRLLDERGRVYDDDDDYNFHDESDNPFPRQDRRHGRLDDERVERPRGSLRDHDDDDDRHERY